MSAPLRLTASQLEDIANALRELSAIRVEHSVSIDTNLGASIRHLDADTDIEIKWDDEDGYVISDRIGS